MTQENKELLLKDLSARLSYGVKIKLGDYDYQVCGYNSEKPLPLKIWYYYKNNSKSLIDVYLTDYCPYLRPMSSMTEEEMVYIDHRFGADLNGDIDPTPSSIVELSDMVNFLTWLNKNHFDYRGLIPKGLAIAVTEENNPYK